MEKVINKHRTLLTTIIRIPEITVLIPVGLLVVLGAIVSKEFLTWSNITGLIRNASYVGLVAIFMTFLLMSKGLDLSCDAVAALTSIILAFALQYLNFSPIIAILLAIVVSSVVGIFNSSINYSNWNALIYCDFRNALCSERIFFDIIKWRLHND